MFSKKQIDDFLSNSEFENYIGSYEKREEDNSLLQGKVATLLLQKENITFASSSISNTQQSVPPIDRHSPDSFTNILKKIRLKALGQILGLSGRVKEGRIDEIRIKTRNFTTNKPEEITIPDFNDEAIVNFAGWYPLEYLIYHFYFLLEIHVQLSKGILKNSFISKLTADAFAIILKHEMWVTANAYRLRKTYGDIIEQKSNKQQQEDKLADFVKDFLHVVKTADPSEYEYRFPCGSNGHAVYLVFIKDNDKHLYLRVDNPSQEEPISYGEFDLTSDTHLELLKSYLIKVCQAIVEGNNNAKSIIEDDKSLPRYTNEQAGYPPLKPQTAPNCVVEGFMRGMWYQLWGVGGTERDEVFKWLYDQNKRFVVTSKSDGGIWLKQRQMRDKSFNQIHAMNETQYNLALETLKQTKIKIKKLAAKKVSIEIGATKKIDFPLSRISVNVQRYSLHSNYDLIGGVNQYSNNKSNEKKPLYFSVIGEAGSGKSVLCQRVRFEWANLDNLKIIIFIVPLNKLSKHEVGNNHEDNFAFQWARFLHQMLQEEFGNLTLTINELEDLINSKESLMFNLDGFDEIPLLLSRSSNHRVMLDWLLTRQNTCFILTTRPGYILPRVVSENATDTLIKLQLIGFSTSNQVDKFIESYVSIVKDNSMKISFSEKFSNIKEISTLLKNPYYCTLLCELYYVKGIVSGENIITIIDVFKMLLDEIQLKYLINKAGYSQTSVIKTAQMKSNELKEFCDPLVSFHTDLAYRGLQKQNIRDIDEGIFEDVYKEHQGKLKDLAKKLDEMNKSFNQKHMHSEYDAVHEVNLFGLIYSEKQDSRIRFAFYDYKLQEFCAAHFIYHQYRDHYEQNDGFTMVEETSFFKNCNIKSREVFRIVLLMLLDTKNENLVIDYMHELQNILETDIISLQIFCESLEMVLNCNVVKNEKFLNSIQILVDFLSKELKTVKSNPNNVKKTFAIIQESQTLLKMEMMRNFIEKLKDSPDTISLIFPFLVLHPEILTNQAQTYKFFVDELINGKQHDFLNQLPKELANRIAIEILENKSNNNIELQTEVTLTYKLIKNSFEYGALYFQMAICTRLTGIRGHMSDNSEEYKFLEKSLISLIDIDFLFALKIVKSFILNKEWQRDSYCDASLITELVNNVIPCYPKDNENSDEYKYSSYRLEVSSFSSLIMRYGLEMLINGVVGFVFELYIISQNYKRGAQVEITDALRRLLLWFTHADIRDDERYEWFNSCKRQFDENPSEYKFRIFRILKERYANVLPRDSDAVEKEVFERLPRAGDHVISIKDKLEGIFSKHDNSSLVVVQLDDISNSLIANWLRLVGESYLPIIDHPRFFPIEETQKKLFFLFILNEQQWILIYAEYDGRKDLKNIFVISNDVLSQYLISGIHHAIQSLYDKIELFTIDGAITSLLNNTSLFKPIISYLLPHEDLGEIFINKLRDRCVMVISPHSLRSRENNVIVAKKLESVVVLLLNEGVQYKKLHAVLNSQIDDNTPQARIGRL